MTTPAPHRYPRTPHAPFSPSAGDGPTADLGPFLEVLLVITEKLDGTNTRLHNGQAYARSAHTAPAPWLAMTRKHHSWKTSTDPVTHLYGEDIYGVHSVRYQPVREDRTLYLFAARTHTLWEPWEQVEAWAQLYNIPTVPVLHQGAFRTERDLRDLCLELIAQPSRMGTEREGIVIRRAQAFRDSDFRNYVCKVVRRDHVQPDEEHWSRHWTPCALIPIPQE